jgi:hypothetical protein
MQLQELNTDGARVEVKATPGAGSDRQARPAEIREHAQQLFRRAGLLRQA